MSNDIWIERSNRNAIALILTISAIVLSTFGNPFFMYIGFFFLAFILLKCYKINIPNLMLLIVSYYWLQIYAALFQNNALNLNIDFNSPLSKAMLLSSIGVFLMSVVFRIQLSKVRTPDTSEITKSIEGFSGFKLFIFYILYMILGGLLIRSLTIAIPALNQFWLSLQSFNWFIFSLLFYKCYFGDGNKLYLWAAILISFLSGLYSYFSNFKEVFLYLFILLSSLPLLLKPKHFIIIFIGVFFVLQFVLIWSLVKNEYRTFLNQGGKSQIVTVNRREAMTKLYQQIQNIKQEDKKVAQEILWSRIQYQGLFSLVLDRVPNVLPHENGNLWLSNLTFVFTPRFLNPNKGILDPSSKSAKYTGMSFATVTMGTSISLGYFTESYIDFGEIGMFFPILIIAFIISRTFRYFASDIKQILVVRYALAVSVVGSFYVMESDGIYLIGRLFFSITTYFVIEKFFLKSILKALLK